MKKSICLLPEIQAVGGPASFQKQFKQEAEKQGVSVHFDPNRKDIGAFLVIGVPKAHLAQLIQSRATGIPIVHRLNGMNWIHRVRPSTAKYNAKAEAVNLGIAFFRRYITTKIVYQSPFCAYQWNHIYGTLRKPSQIIYNGVDTNLFFPHKDETTIFTQQNRPVRILVVEGNLQHGTEFMLQTISQFSLALAQKMRKDVSLTIAGNVDAEAKTKITTLFEYGSTNISIDFPGIISKENLVRLAQQSEFLFSAELNPACPNAVIEALSCGLPIIGFDTGSLADITGKGGMIAPYGGNAWKLEEPQFLPLINAAEQIYNNPMPFRQNARERAKTLFPIEKIAKEYIDFCLGS